MSAVDEVSTVLVKNFGVDPGAIDPVVPLRDLRMDSLALEEMRLILEERLTIDLNDIQLTSRDSVGQLVAVVHAKIAA